MLIYTQSDRSFGKETILQVQIERCAQYVSDFHRLHVHSVAKYSYSKYQFSRRAQNNQYDQLVLQIARPHLQPHHMVSWQEVPELQLNPHCLDLLDQPLHRSNCNADCRLDR